jgi:hypothetical protein
MVCRNEKVFPILTVHPIARQQGAGLLERSLPGHHESRAKKSESLFVIDGEAVLLGVGKQDNGHWQQTV